MSLKKCFINIWLLPKCLLGGVQEAGIAVHPCNSALLRTIMKTDITRARTDSVGNSSRLGNI